MDIKKLTMKEKTIIIPVLVSIFLFLITSFITSDAGIIGNVIVICIFIVILPYFLYSYSEYLWLRAVENQFPNFIRDLADSKRSGMSLPEAVKLSTKANYGKLSHEIQRMSNRLSWGTPFLRVIDIFGERVKKSRIIQESLQIIKESYKSGGEISATLTSVAKDIRILQDAENERRSTVKQHVLVMYGIFFVFLGVSIAIIFVMVPMMRTDTSTGISSPLAFSFTSPCPEGAGQIFPCGLFFGICDMLGVSKGVNCYYIALFFSILIVEGIFIGLIAGQLGENSPIAGVKHSLIMVSAAIVIFLFLAKFGLLPM